MFELIADKIITKIKEGKIDTNDLRYGVMDRNNSQKPKLTLYPDIYTKMIVVVECYILNIKC